MMNVIRTTIRRYVGIQELPNWMSDASGHGQDVILNHWDGHPTEALTPLREGGARLMVAMGSVPSNRLAVFFHLSEAQADLVAEMPPGQSLLEYAISLGGQAGYVMYGERFVPSGVVLLHGQTGSDLLFEVQERIIRQLTRMNRIARGVGWYLSRRQVLAIEPAMSRPALSV